MIGPKFLTHEIPYNGNDISGIHKQRSFFS